MADTILLTGASGFIAKHCVLALLNAGYAVRGTVRRLDRGDEVRAAVAPHLDDPAALERLSFIATDLTADAGWPEAMAGATAVIHTASPFPVEVPKDEMVLIRPAVEGTARVLNAAAEAGITRVVLTSSTAAITDPRRGRVQTGADWADPDAPETAAYAKSKTLAEREAWAVAKARGLALTTVNPGFVVGPPLDRHFGSSIGVVRRFLAGKDPAMPKIGFPMVDVRDVAALHVIALQRPETAGQRIVAVAGCLWFSEMGKILKTAYPDRRIPTMTAPKPLLRLLALFDPQIRAILPSVGQIDEVSGAATERGLDFTFIPPAEALRASATWLVENKAV